MINSLESLSVRVAELAEQAGNAGTFGVGGVLVDDANNIVTTMVNRVVDQGRISDPTAHVERQIVDWYFERVRNGVSLPPPNKMTIISSLDPCMMCAGSILSAGFNVVSLNFDDFAGVNFDGKALFGTLPSALAKKAVATFGYCGTAGKSCAQGTVPVFLRPAVVNEAIKNRAHDAFFNTLSGVRDSINCTDSTVSSGVQNLFNTPPSLLKDIREGDPHFLSLQNISLTSLSDELADILVDEAKAAAHRGAKMNAAALVDSSGNLLMVSGGDEQISPIRTAFMQLTRRYAQLRATLGRGGNNILPAPKDCAVVLLKGPGREAQDIVDMGAFGSTMEGPMSDGFAHFQYIVPAQTQSAMDSMADRFPPLYRDLIKVRPAGTTNQAIVNRCTASLK